jgi:hypothetical protein
MSEFLPPEHESAEPWKLTLGDARGTRKAIRVILAAGADRAQNRGVKDIFTSKKNKDRIYPGTGVSGSFDLSTHIEATGGDHGASA